MLKYLLTVIAAAFSSTSRETKKRSSIFGHMAVAAGGASGWGGFGGGGGFGGRGGGDKLPWFNPMSLLEDMEDDEEEEEDEDLIKVLKKRPNSRDLRLAKRRKTRRAQLNNMVKCPQLRCFKALQI